MEPDDGLNAARGIIFTLLFTLLAIALVFIFLKVFFSSQPPALDLGFWQV